jgi:hypothetical protein
VCGWGLIGISWPEGASDDGNEILRDLVFLCKDVIFFKFQIFLFLLETNCFDCINYVRSQTDLTLESMH